MKRLGVITLAVAAIGLVLFFVLVMPADRRGEAACIEEMHARSAQPAHEVAREVHEACEEHRRQETPMRFLGIVVFLTFIGGMFMYRRGAAADRR